MSPSLKIDPSAAVSISEQIAEQVRLSIASGRLVPGDRLESVRGLARELLVNPNTVAKVYRDLEREGILDTRPGSGVFVAPGAPAKCRRAGARAVREAVEAAVEKGLAAGLAPEEIEELWRESLEKAGGMIHAE
ncbi:MAG: GntR family transcriptional regulator [Candidatus Latescibacteria bacterium]|nr:GntR family transcriptional regulator [Candidatus Latescibacterota bacterium]